MLAEDARLPPQRQPDRRSTHAQATRWQTIWSESNVSQGLQIDRESGPRREMTQWRPTDLCPTGSRRSRWCRGRAGAGRAGASADDAGSLFGGAEPAFIFGRKIAARRSNPRASASSKTHECWTVDVQNTHQLAARYQGDYNLRPGRGIAGNVSGNSSTSRTTMGPPLPPRRFRDPSSRGNAHARPVFPQGHDQLILGSKSPAGHLQAGHRKAAPRRWQHWR